MTAMTVTYEDIAALAHVVGDLADEVASLSVGATAQTAAASVRRGLLGDELDTAGRRAHLRHLDVVAQLREAARALRRAGQTYPRAEP